MKLTVNEALLIHISFTATSALPVRFKRSIISPFRLACLISTLISCATSRVCFLLSLPVQNRRDLSAYDDLIEVNTRRIALLEEMAAGRIASGSCAFVPGHERVRMVESAMGLVPEGWEVVKTGDAIDREPADQSPRRRREAISHWY